VPEALRDDDHEVVGSPPTTEWRDGDADYAREM
jgi:hypothetical protein